MAEWSKNKVDASLINGGKEFTTDDNLAVNELNAMVNNSFYGVEFVKAMADAPDISEIAGDGTPSVSLVPNGEFMKFKFSNLKGDKGEKGERGDKGEKGESGESNSLIKYLGSIVIDQMLVRDLFSLIGRTFGTSCNTYYIATENYSDHPITISVSQDGTSINETLLAKLTNKWSGETISADVQQIVTNQPLGVSGGTGIFNYHPFVYSDYIEIGKCSVLGSSPTRYNVRYSWAGYELNVLDVYGTDPYIKCPTSSIRVYGVV